MPGEANTDTQMDTQGTQVPQDGMEDELTHPVLTGHPAFNGEQELSGPSAGEEGAGGEGGEGGEREELKPPEGEKSQEDTGGGEAPKLKYKTHEEAEAAQKEAERKMHEATTQASQEKEAREALQRELDELKAKSAESGGEKPPEQQAPVSPEDRRAKLLSVATAANKKALAKIAELDRTDPDYSDHVAAAWAEANAEAFMESGIPTSSLSEAEISKMVKRQLEAERQAERDQNSRETAARVWDKAVGIAEKSGLNMGDEDSADYILFDRFARKLPDDMKKEPLAKQVDWVVGQVRSRVGQAVQTDKQREEAARQHQNNNAVLERGSLTPRTTPKVKPGHLDDDFDAVRTSRTI